MDYSLFWAALALIHDLVITILYLTPLLFVIDT